MNMACPPVPFEMTADERHKRPISIPNPKTQISALICLCGVQKICANIFPEKNMILYRRINIEKSLSYYSAHSPLTQFLHFELISSFFSIKKVNRLKFAAYEQYATQLIRDGQAPA